MIGQHSYRLDLMGKKMRKVNTVLDEVEQYRMRMKRRRDFSFMSTSVEEHEGSLI